VNELLNDVFFSREPLVRELVAMMAAHDWKITAGPVREALWHMWAVPASTKFLLEDAFGKNADVRLRQGKNKTISLYKAHRLITQLPQSETTVKPMPLDDADQQLAQQGDAVDPDQIDAMSAAQMQRKLNR
jgi:hypothetical protein